MKLTQTCFLTPLFFLCLAIGYSSPVFAGQKHPAVNGTILEVKVSDVIIEVQKGKDTTEVTIKTDQNTEVKIDGREATVSDLKPGMRVNVPAHEDVASKIHASSKDRHDNPGQSDDDSDSQDNGRGKGKGGDKDKDKGKNKDKNKQ